MSANFFVHQMTLNSCIATHNQIVKLSQDVKEKLDKNKSVASVKDTDVLEADRGRVTEFTESYRHAIKLLDSSEAVQACKSSANMADLGDKAKAIEKQLAAAKVAIVDLDNKIKAVKLAIDNKKMNDIRDSVQLRIDQLNESAQAPMLSQDYKDNIDKEIDRVIDAFNNKKVNLAEATKMNESLQSLVNDVNKELARVTSGLAKVEASVQQVQNYVDADRTYVSAAKDILAAAGKEMVVGIDKASPHCNITHDQAESWLAAYCPNTADKVYVNPNYFGTTAYTPYFADTMRHELGHNFIYMRCGTTSPKSIFGTANEESTASAYAVLYLGADMATLNQASDPRYYMTTDAFASARKIRSGQCN